MTPANRPNKPSPDTLVTILNHLAHVSPVIAEACREVNYTPSSFFGWLKNSRLDPVPDKLLVRWPDPEGRPVPLWEAVVQARQINLAHLEGRLRADCFGVPRVLRTPAGDIVYEVDDLLLAQYGGDADKARAAVDELDYPLYPDPFYKHDAAGARIPVIVHDQQPAALKVHVARSTLGHAGYNPQTEVAQTVAVTGGVLVTKAIKQGGGDRPSYARAAQPPAEVSPLRADLLKRLEDLRKNGPAHPPSPTSPPLYTGSGRADHDPPEMVTGGGPAAPRPGQPRVQRRRCEDGSFVDEPFTSSTQRTTQR